MTLHRRAIRLAAGTALLLAAACAGSRALAPLAPPEGARALGLEFGADRRAAARALDAAEIAHRPAPGDPDALLADRCPAAPEAPCRLLFGPEGLYAAQLEVPARDERALRAAAERGLGRARPARPAAGGGAPLLAAWERPGWSVGLSRVEPEGGPATAVLHLEYDGAAPPVVLGVPLGRRRAEVEHVLERQGATVVQRDETATTYLGCPDGAAEALSCLVVFRDGRAAAVTEVYAARADDAEALAAWRALAARYEADIGRAPETHCPASGPDRVGGDCTASWTSRKLQVVVGAHRGAGSRRRGAISVYTGFAYPPLGAAAEGSP